MSNELLGCIRNILFSWYALYLVYINMKEHKGWISFNSSAGYTYCKSRFQECQFLCFLCYTGPTNLILVGWLFFYEDSFRGAAEGHWQKFTFTGLPFFCLLT